MIYLKKYYFVLAFVALSTLTATAQPEDPDAPTPFGFVEVLIGAGALLGGKKAYDARKKNTEE
ncbi:MAG: hypothetical protein ACPF9D_13430 [Owenweeksia sp.]